MRKLLLIIVVLGFLSTIADAQLWKLRRYEATIGMGTTQFFGDIGGFSIKENLLGIKDFTFLQTRFNVSAAFKYRIRNDLSVRFNLAFGSFHATDSRGSNETRGFESKTLFFEPALLCEYYFIKNTGENSFLMLKGNAPFFKSISSMLDIYVFTGFGALSYNVRPNDLLKSRATKLNGFTPVIPLGVGVKLVYSNYFNFGIEFGGRFAFSDNVDGYTSRYSRANDIYHILNFTLTYKLSTNQKGFPTFRQKLF